MRLGNHHTIESVDHLESNRGQPVVYPDYSRQLEAATFGPHSGIK